MGEYFKGWKRKTGIVMLVLACLCAAGWVRSPVPPSTLAAIGFKEWQAELKDGQCIMKKERDSYIGGREFLPGLREVNLRNPEIERFRTYYVYPGVKYSIEKDRESDTDAMHTHVVTSVQVNLPFFAIVATLLSAYLLLPKPRVATPPKTVEPDRA